MKKLFQVAVILHKYEETDKGRVYKDSQIIVEPKFELAKTENEVVFKMTREIPEEFTSNPEDVQIIIRNF